MASENKPDDALKFILAGNANFTLKSLRTGKHYTFKVKAPWDAKAGKFNYEAEARFVSVLAGSDNESDYRFIGTFFVSEGRLGGSSPKTRLNGLEAAFFGLKWVLENLYIGTDLAAKVEILHAGKCGRCGRKLTTPESIKAGFGPECINLV